jgi:hypothetical protein
MLTHVEALPTKNGVVGSYTVPLRFDGVMDDLSTYWGERVRIEPKCRSLPLHQEWYGPENPR